VVAVSLVLAKKSAIPAKGDRGLSESAMWRSYSELQHADDITALALAPYGLGRPTMSRAGWSPVGGGNGGHVEMAVSLISTRLMKMISNRSGGNARS
jgi:hypothetical protein